MRLWWVLSWAAAAGGAFAPFPGPGPAVTVATPLGVVEGRQDQEATSFLGVPFVEPPVGPLRWALPVPKRPWNGPWNATRFSPGCPQTCRLPPLTCPAAYSENCITLNIFRPNNATGKRLPVMAFLPGGNFQFGGAGTMVYDARRWAARSNVVIVTISYRLGPLGWLVQDGIPINLGIEDQRVALRFIRDHIALFGGDEKSITLFGQSAGATSIAYHLLSAKSGGLFDRYVMESNPIALPLKNPDDGKRLGDVFMKNVGCAKGDIDCLRAKSVKDIVDAQDETNRHFDIFDPFLLFYPWTPIVDTTDVPRQPIELLHEGKGPNIPGIMGTVANESVIFIYLSFGEKGMSDFLYEAFVVDAFPLHFDEILHRYPKTLGGNSSMAAAYLATDFLFTCANRWAIRGQATVADTFLYKFDHPLSFGSAVWGSGPGAHCDNLTCHAGELPMLFDPVPDLLPKIHMTPDELVLTAEMESYWSNFAYSKDPSSGPVTPKVTWPKYSESTDMNMRLTTPNSFVQSHLQKEACDFWDSIGYARGDVIRFQNTLSKYIVASRNR